MIPPFGTQEKWGWMFSLAGNEAGRSYCADDAEHSFHADLFLVRPLSIVWFPRAEFVDKSKFL